MIRLIIVGLVVINLVIFIWSIVGNDTGPVESDLSQPGMGTIRLIDEAEISSQPPQDAMMPETRLELEGAAPESVTFGYIDEPEPYDTDFLTESMQAAPDLDSGQVIQELTQQQSQDEDLSVDQPEETTSLDPSPDDLDADELGGSLATSAPPELTAEMQELPGEEEPPSHAVEIQVEQAEVPEQAQDQEEKQVPEVVSTPRTCGEISQIIGRNLVDDLTSQLAEKKIKSQGKEVVVKEEIGFWVLIPRLKSRALGKARVAELKEAGLSDVWLFLKGPNKNTISLGLFGTRKNAARRAKKAQQLGFETEIKSRFKVQTQYQLSYEGEISQAELEKILVLFDDKGIERQYKTCP